MKTLRPYQQEVFEWAKNRDRIALFLKMRLGKSVITIHWAESRKQKKSILVVAPKTPLLDWCRELTDAGLKHVVLRSGKNVLDQVSNTSADTRWYLCNYETLHQSVKYVDDDGETRRTIAPGPLCEIAWDTVILDESTTIKNPQAQITKTCVTWLSRDVPNRAILTGTPAPESPLEYFPQFQFLHGSFCGYDSYWKFRAGMFYQSGFDWEPKKGCRERIADEVHRLSYTLTRKEAGVHVPKVRETIYCDFPPHLKAKQRTARKLFELDGEYTKWIIVVTTWLLRLAGGVSYRPDERHKLDVLHRLMRTRFRDKCVVVWFRFNREIDEALVSLMERGWSVRKIDGRESTEERVETMKLFRSGKVDILLAQAKCARFGLDCSNAAAMIYFSRWHDLITNAQSEDRGIRLDRPDPLPIIDLVSRGTIDEDLIDLLKKKHLDSSLFLSSLATRLKRRLFHVRED